jgi:NTP pyrophosphatase (non-canonical NTP hydrolase)
MPKLKKDPNLSDFQDYIKLLCKERGWDKNDPLEIFLLFSEEIGELAKAIRNRMKIYHEEGKQFKEDELEDEFADVFSYLLDLANQFNIDLETAFRKKEEKNSKRMWKNNKS